VTQVFSFPSGDPAEFEGLSEPDMAAHLEPDVLADDIRAFYAGRR
jgi:hypothetical protein